MAVTSSPVAVQTPSATCVQVATANANVDGATGTYSTAITVGANGGKLYGVWYQAISNTTAGVIRIFLADDGATYRLIGETLKTAVTFSSGVTNYFTGSWTPPFGPLPVTASAKVRFSITENETVNCHLSRADF